MVPSQQRFGGSPIRILIVEDNPEDRELYRRILDRSKGVFQIYEAANVAEGLKIIKQNDMDCILLDYKLPDGDGIDFIHACREMALTGNAAIVMVTGQGSEKTAVEAMKMGALDYITKNTILEGYFTQSILNAVERAQLKREILRYQQDLVRSNRALSEFTHTASHDLKAPLRHIISYCEVIRDELSGKMGKEVDEYTKRLIVNARRMQQLVDDLLAYSEAINAKSEKEPVDCNSVLAEVMETLEEVIRESKAAIKAENLPQHVMSHPLQLRQVFQNLISNAIKYRGKETPVIVVRGEERDKDFVLSFTDNGSGIPKEHQESIFEAFKRLHSRDEIEGSGLGLSICRKIIEAQGGKIWVESEPGKGSTFYFTLPKQQTFLAAEQSAA